MADHPAPIIVKRKKIIAGGHHGGAWKVAYADFVTAMMAFFLLMWLLGATNEKQRIVLGRADRLAGGDHPLGVFELVVDGTEVLQRDHRAGVRENRCHLAFSSILGAVIRLVSETSFRRAGHSDVAVAPRSPRHLFWVRCRIHLSALKKS